MGTSNSAGDLTWSARPGNGREKSTSEELLFAEVSRFFCASLDIERCILFLFDGAHERLEPVHVIGVDPAKVSRLQETDDYPLLLARLQQVDRVELIDSTPPEDPLRQVRFVYEGLPAGVLLPAKAHGILYGAAILGLREKGGPDVRGRLLSSAAVQLGLMVENLRLRESVRKAEQRYDDLFNLTPEFGFVLAPDGTILDTNQSAATTFGLIPTDGFGRQIFDFLAEHSHDDFARALSDAVRLKRSREFEVQFRRQDGQLVDAVLNLSAYFDSKFDTNAVYAAGRDVTERKKADLQLLRFANAIHFTVNPIEITDVDGRIIYVNPAFERGSGYTKEELIGKNPAILNSRKHSSEFWSKMWRAIMAGKVWTGEVVNRRKNGELMYTELLISPILDAAGRVIGFLGSHTDVTEKKHLQEQLFRSQKLESIGTLAAGIAHEVGNPLTSISSLVQIIQRTTGDKFAREKLDLVREQINRIAKIIRQLVDFSRPTNYEIKPTDVNALVKSAVSIVQYGKKAKQVTFTLDCAPDIPAVEVVQDQLIQVFINVLINAVDSLDGKPGTVRVATRGAGELIEVGFTDNGCGMSPAVLGKIFEPFFTTKRVGEGTGLGLWVSYGIIQNMGGDVAVRSTPGGGSVFTVTIPRRTAGY
ncbi:MAG: hypothetical protein COS95_04975 [Ignavibacteriales bacterium CG07_land_8_20_14_0_80_59_12]|nr:MAG: hypothetical protein COS95_04975 [Ignavibacteriales bacterium CG07_land_8_20_14_0_80_59_12]